MYKVIKASTYDNYLDDLYQQYVPVSGKADTLLGEILRAFAQIRYRYYNDGDQIGDRYGRETCNPAARFLASKIPSLKLLNNFADDPSMFVDYKDFLDELEWKVDRYVMNNEEKLASTRNSEDMWSYKTGEDRDDFWDDEEEDDYY